MLIRGRRIGAGRPPYVIAEIGINHNGDVSLARQMIESAAKAGADAVKFQAFRAEHLVAPSRSTLSHVEGSVLELFHGLELSEDAFRSIAGCCRENTVAFIATAFDLGSADMLLRTGVDALKIASGDLTHLPLLKHVGALGKPVILSTGASTLVEVRRAVGALRRAASLGILHCVSAYPAPPAQMNLRAIPSMSRALRLPVGISDHTLGIHVAVAATALGAVLIEKHFTTSRSLPGPDQALSIEPAELSALVRAVRDVQSALGDGKKLPMRCEKEARIQARRGIYVARDLAKGARIGVGDLTVLRPARGISPENYDKLLGKRTTRGFRRGHPLRRSDLA